ncbi:MAG: energy transducer TonB [Acidobacteriia bacterium]|nr:energy transducer TonB [Terriglobia bacterium]
MSDVARTIAALAIFTVISAGAQQKTSLLSSVAPIPADPLELATGQGKVLDTAQDRASVLALLDRAQQNATLQAPAAAPFTLKTSFEAAGALANVGPGEMTDVWLSPSRWGWSAQLGGYSQQRVLADGRIHDHRVGTFVPMRLQMVRAALFWPINFNPRAMMRIASGKIGDTDLLCALFSGRMNDTAAMSAEPGRRWVETEYCADPKTGLLRVYSEAPGIYVVYDYQGAMNFHGRIVPRNIAITEAGAVALSIRVESITDPAEAEVALLQHSPLLQAIGPQPALSYPMRFPQAAAPPEGFRGEVHPIIVHATVGPEGQVLEEEALQTSDPVLTQAALDLVRRSTYPPSSTFRSAAGWQREYFINVRFTAPSDASMPRRR